MKKKLIFAFYTHIPKIYPLWDRIKLNIVQKWTKSDMYHVEVMFNEKWISANTTGIEVTPIRQFDPKYTYVEIEVDTCSEQNLRIHNWLDSIVGEPYDNDAIWYRQFINIGKQDENAWICSELANKILQMYLVKPFIRIESSTMNPKDIYNKLKSRPDVKETKADVLNKEYNLPLFIQDTENNKEYKYK